VLDFVPPVPSRLPVARFSRREELQRGALAVATPGNLAGWAELVRAYGQRPFAEALKPAIALAADGFGLAEFGAAEFNEQTPLLRAHPLLFEEFARNYALDSSPVAVGRIVRQPQLARTLERVAADGIGHLYGGALGEAVVAHLTRLGGCLTLEDLTGVKPLWKDPLVARYRHLAVHTLPPPSEAFQFLLTLRVLERFDLARLERNGVAHLDTLWRTIRLAAGERIANNLPTPERLARVMGDDNCRRLEARVRDGTPIEGPTEQWTAAPDDRCQGEHHTTSFSIADRAGNLVCITQSLGSPFGSGVVVPDAGLCLNNFLFWADINPRSPNRTRPGSALPLCMAPSIALSADKPVLVLGTPGSYGILQTQVQALVQHLDYSAPLQEAIEQPRARLWDGRRVEVEARFAPAVLQELTARGHAVELGEPWTMRVGGMQGVAIDPATGLMTGACDPRRDGYVATA
jgi:gamma-glutamyltranspeptidase/glutathione hydrolase